jgi:hypothetical protein
MDRTLGLPTVIAAQAPAGWGMAASARKAPLSQLDVDSVARRMNDVVVHRIFAAELDLQAALGLLGDRRTADPRPSAGEPPAGKPAAGNPAAAGEHPAATKIWHATDELDHAIRDLRDILFEPW